MQRISKPSTQAVIITTIVVLGAAQLKKRWQQGDAIDAAAPQVGAELSFSSEKGKRFKCDACAAAVGAGDGRTNFDHLSFG